MDILVLFLILEESFQLFTTLSNVIYGLVICDFEYVEVCFLISTLLRAFITDIQFCQMLFLLFTYWDDYMIFILHFILFYFFFILHFNVLCHMENLQMLNHPLMLELFLYSKHRWVDNPLIRITISNPSHKTQIPLK